MTSTTGFAWPRLTPAVKVLLIANVAVFALNAVFRGELAQWLGVSWAGLWEGFGLGLVRLVTYQFVHSFYSAWHVIGNMLVLYFFGTMVEESIGRARLVRLYLVSGAVGGAAQVLFNLARGDVLAVTVGASGAVLGIPVYAACMAPRLQVIFIVFPIELRWLAIGLVGLGVYDMYVEVATGVAGGVAHGGHLGGALWGFVAWRLPRAGWAAGFGEALRGLQRERGRRAAVERQQRLDQLLDKVHREGIGSLTQPERRFLDRASREARRR